MSTAGKAPGEIDTGQLRPHPEASRVPMMTGPAWDDFMADIKERGVRVPLEVEPGTHTVLDGRCRLLAAKRNGIATVPVIEANLQGDDPVLYMLRAASLRRHLTDDQRAMLANEERKYLAGKNQQERAAKAGKSGGRSRPKKRDSLETDAFSKLSPMSEAWAADQERKERGRAQAARQHNVSERKVRQAQQVEEAAPALAEKVRAGEVTLAQAAREVQREQKREELLRKAEEADQAARQLEEAGQLPWRIVHGDCLEALEDVEQGSVNLVFADPPYNIGVDYGDGAAADRLPAHEFLSWCAAWLTLCNEVLAPDGSLWLLISDEWAAQLKLALERLGLTVRAWVKWHETFGVCNSARANFSRTSRHLFYCVKDPDSFTWNPEAVTRPSDRQTKYGDARAEPGGKVWDDVWEVPRLVGTAAERIPDFPTQLPLALLRPVVGCSSNPGDLVLDPFAGSCVAGEAAVLAGRRFLGIERQARFVERATQRMKGLRHEEVRRRAGGEGLDGRAVGL